MELFKFTEEQEMLRKAVREFVESEIAPKAAEWDEKDYCPVELWPVMGELGILGIFIPEEYGGTGLGHRKGDMSRGNFSTFCRLGYSSNDSSPRNGTNT